MLKPLIALTLFTMAALATAQHDFPVAHPKFVLATNKKVQAHLKMTDEQVKKVDAVLSGVVQDDGNGRKMIMLGGDTDIEQLDKDVLVLFDKDQSKRFDELYLQQNGYAALSRKEYSSKLDLSKEQIDRLDKVWQNHRDRMQSYFMENEPGSKELKVTREDLQKLKKTTDSEAEAVLTKEQNEKWKAMQGEAFDFEEKES